MIINIESLIGVYEIISILGKFVCYNSINQPRFIYLVFGSVDHLWPGWDHARNGFDLAMARFQSNFSNPKMGFFRTIASV